MTIYTDGPRLRNTGNISELDSGLGGMLGATVGEAVHELPTVRVAGMGELAAAQGTPAPPMDPMLGYDPFTPEPAEDKTPTTPLDAARARVKQEGLDRILKLPEQPEFREPALQIMIDRAREKNEREATIARGPSGFWPGALSIGTSFAIGALDPLNIGAAFIPVVGELRYAKLMESAGTSAMQRLGVRGATGAASGAVGMVPMIGIEAAARSQEGQDYTMNEALRTLMFGGALGGVLHGGGGMIADILRGRKGTPLFPFAPGEHAGPAVETGLLDGALAGEKSVPSPARQIYDDAREKLIAAGVSEEEAAQNAAIVAARYATRADRLGHDPEHALDLYREANLEIRRAGDEAAPEGARQYAQSANAPMWYSTAERTIAAAKQEKASPDQWLGMLRNATGVKAEELQWLGLEGWLKEQKGSVTKQAISDYIRANQIEVKEIEKGAVKLDSDRLEELRENPNRTPAEENEFWRLADDASNEASDGVSPTKFSSYQLPGGENYREMLLTLPERGERAPITFEEWQRHTGRDDTPEARLEYQQGWGSDGNIPAPENFRSSHWDEPNVLAHVRFNDRTINGKKTLFLEEVQSDWHQKGKREGYKSEAAPLTAAEQDELTKLRQMGGRVHDDETTYERYSDLQERFAANYNRVPDAPFKTTWPELAMKRMIRYAAEHGYDQIAWTPGEVQAARYDLSKHVDAVRAVKRPSDGAFVVSVKQKGPSDRAADIVFTPLNDGQAIAPDKLSDHVGKELAEKIIAQGGETKVYRGLDLKVGGEGMKGFYDDILPATANKLVKKYGGKVKQEKLKVDTENMTVEHSPNGLGDVDDFSIVDGEGRELGFYDTEDAASAALSRMERERGAASVHAVAFTLELKRAAVEQGFPLFQKGGSGEPRGRITFGESKTVIDLFEKANASTFMHEAGHLWLDELVRDAAHAKAPWARDDLKSVLGWLGVEKAEDIGVAQHEQWARGFEQFLAEGKAPSPRLTRAFEKFRQWLAAIYRSLTELGTPINDDVRAVMGRLLATDEEMALSPTVRALDDLPPRAKEDVLRASIAAVTTGEPVRIEEMLAEAAKIDPRIAESLAIAKSDEGLPPVADVLPGPRAARGPRARDPETFSLLEFLAHEGGLKPTPELDTMFGGKQKFIPGFGPLLRKNGMDLDKAREKALESKYFFDAAAEAGDRPDEFTINHLLDAMDTEARGAKQYRAGADGLQSKAEIERMGEREKAAYEAHIDGLSSDLDTALQEASIKPAEVAGKLRERVVEIMDKEREADPLVAYERAVMEEIQNATEQGAGQRIADHIPGWDVPDVAGSAPAAGREPARAGDAAGERTGSPQRLAGAGNREPFATAWGELATGRLEYADPAIVEASHAAEALAEPASISPNIKNRIAAAEKLATEADEAFRAQEPYLPAEEQARLKEAFAKADIEAKDHAEIINQGAACLAAAVTVAA